MGYPRDARVSSQARGQDGGAGLGFAHAKGEGREAPEQEVRGERMQKPARGDPDLPEAAGPGLRRRDDPRDDVSVTAEELRGAVEDEGRACSTGFWRTGVAKVLSTRTGTSPPASTTASMSTSPSVGFWGVSRSTSPVAGVIDSATVSAVAHRTRTPRSPDSSRRSQPP